MPARPLNDGELIDASLIARFRADLLPLFGAEPSASSRLGLAVSGGGDSLALLLLATAAFPHGIAVATVDHGLRPEAAQEACDVADICARLNAPHTTLRADARSSETGNLQHWARTTRYRLLAGWAQTAGIGHIATGHHRDDVAETFLMRAARGGGVRSLAAMPAIRPFAGSRVLLVRPLLGWTRAELAAIVAAAGLAAARDPSNANSRFDRARIRRLLAATPDLPADGLARAAGNLRDVEEALEWTMARELAARFAEADGEVRIDPAGLPFELKRRFAARAIETVRQQRGVFSSWRETAVPALVRALDNGGGGTVADVMASAREGLWYFRTAPPRRSDESTAARGK